MRIGINLAKIIVLLLAIVKEISNATSSYTGSINVSQNCSTSAYAVNLSNVKTLSIKFMLNSFFACSNILMVASFTPIPCSNFSIESIQYNQYNNIYTNKESANGCDQQRLNIPIPNNTIYFIYVTIFNWNAQPIMFPVSYNLQINTLSAGKMCHSCSPGARLKFGSSNPMLCQCQPCPTDYVGSYCQYFLQPLFQNRKYVKNLIGSVAYYFRIADSTETIMLSFGQSYSTNSTYLYMQYESVSGQIAGPFNNYYISSGNPFRQLITTDTSNMQIQTKGTNILLAIIHPSTGNASVFIQYQANIRSPNFAAIIGGVIGGFFGLVLIISVICLLKRRYSSSRSGIKNSNMPIQQSILQEDNLNLYFPAVAASSVLGICSKQNESMSDLNEKQLQTGFKSQCIICLNEIGDDELIRVTYCRHIYHAVCLVSWFKKNENCPYCRKQFNLKATHQMFLYFQKKDRIVQKIDLILAILDDKIQKQKRIKYQKSTESKKQELSVQDE